MSDYSPDPGSRREIPMAPSEARAPYQKHRVQLDIGSTGGQLFGLPWVFVISPYRGTPKEMEENRQRAASICRGILQEGKVPIAPHLYCPQFLPDEDDPAVRGTGMTIGRQLMQLCDEVRIYGPRITEGMAQDIVHAIKLGKPISTR